MAVPASAALWSRMLEPALTDQNTSVGNAISATDADPDDTVTYTLKQTSAEFKIDTSSGQIMVADDLNFNREQTAVYTLTVVASDDFIVPATAEQEVVINITDDPVEMPSVYASVSLSSPGHTRTEITLQWNVVEYHAQFDEEDREPILISYETADAAAVIRSVAQDATGYTITGLTPEASYTLSLRWKSSGSGFRWSNRIAVGANANNIPVFDGGASVSRALVENVGTALTDQDASVGNPISATDADPDDTVTYALKQTSTEFKIDTNSGQIMVAGDLNFNREQTAGYTLTVVASDDFNPPASAEQEVVINITDDPVEMPSVYASVSLSSPGHTRTEITLQWNVAEYHAQFDEEDRDKIVISYETADAAAVTQEVAQDATGYTFTGLSANTAYTLSLRWKSSGTGFRWSNQIAVGANANNIPVFDGDGSVTRSLTENAGTALTDQDTSVGNPISATDADPDDTVTYALKQTSIEFKIDTSSGQIMVADNLNFNHEQTAAYTLTIVASDDFTPPSSAEQVVVISITDINEAPQFPALQDIYQATRRGNFSISPATDPDAGDSLAYTASLPGSWLTFQSSDLRFAIALNAPLGMHTITITATDTGGLSVKEEFALEVLVAPNADPSFARARAEFEIVLDGNELTVPVGIVIGTVSATDPDADRLTYRIMPTDVRVRINSQSGAIETTQELAAGVYQFTVEAADGKGGTARIAVRLVVRTGDDMEEQVALTVIDRSTAMAATDIIHRHLETPLSQPETLTAADSTDSEQLPAYLRMASDVEQWQDWRYDHESHAAQSERTQLRDFLYNRGFDFAFAGSGPRARALRVWGAGSRDALNGTPEIDDEQVAYDGNASLFMVGAETSMSRTRMGIAAGRAKTKLALANTKSRVQRQLNSIHPYLSFQASDQLQLWATGGFGRGDLVVLEDSGNQNTRNARNVSAAGGFKVNWKRAKINLAAGMNMLAMQSRLAADRDRALPASISRFWRTNLDFNVSRAFAPTAEISFRPFVGAQIRRDGGDNWLDMRALDATAGIDINWIRGLSAKITSRYQINKGEFRERNVNGSISYDMDSDRRGLMLSVSPSMASSNDASFSRSLSARAGYGLPMRLFADSGLTTISTDFSSTETGSGAYSYGLSFAGRRLQVDLTAAGETLTGRISIR